MKLDGSIVTNSNIIFRDVREVITYLFIITLVNNVISEVVIYFLIIMLLNIKGP